jgi:hypothetical protein
MNQANFGADGLAGHELEAEQLTQIQGGKSIAWGPIVPGSFFHWPPAPAKQSIFDKALADVKKALQGVL